MSSSFLHRPLRSEREAREEIALALEHEAIMWTKRGDDMTNTMAQAVCYSLANEATERAKQQRSRARALRAQKETT